MKNVNTTHNETLSRSDRFAIWLTSKVGTMTCFYVFCVIALVSLPAALLSHNLLVIVSWVAQTFIQLVLLPLIMVGTNLLGRHAEIQANADYETNIKAEQEIRLLKKLVEDNTIITQEIHHLISDHDPKRTLTAH